MEDEELRFGDRPSRLSSIAEVAFGWREVVVVNDKFCPNDFVTRGQVAAFLKRALT